MKQIARERKFERVFLPQSELEGASVDLAM